MSKAVFKEFASNQAVLFPESISDRIPENHPVRLVDHVVDQLNIDRIMKAYKGWGACIFHPRMMLPDQKHVYIGTTVKGNSDKISSVGIVGLLHEGKVYVLTGKSPLAKSMDMNGLASPTISCKSESCTACAVSFTDTYPFVKCHCTTPDCPDCNCNMNLMVTMDMEVFE